MVDTAAQAFARMLRGLGLRRVYGLPGEDHLRLLDALEAEGIKYIGARDETAATLMAATEAEATHLPGVVLVTIAPGLTNAINGLAHAYLDSIPLVIVTGQHSPERAPLIVRQQVDNHRLVQGLVKWTAVASGRIHQVLARVFDTSLAPRAGPVLLELREDLAGMTPLDQAEDWPVLQSDTRSVRGAGSSGQPLPREVSELIGGATWPAVVVGGACPHAAPIADVARSLRAPTFTSPSAMGIISLPQPWFAGTFMNGNLEASVLERSDLIITVGLDAKDFFNAAWRYTAPIIAINEYADTQRFAPTTYQLLGDTTAHLQTLSLSSCASEWAESDVAAYRRGVERPFHLDDEHTLTIPSAVRNAREVLPPETVVAVDAGFGKPLTSYLWSTPRPNMYFSAHGLSTMGYAVPAANALQLTYPERPVVGFMGDGSLLMRASEITVAAEHRIAPIYVAWMDGSLAQIETKQLRQQLRPVGARLPRISCAKVADAFGGVGADVDTLDAFRRALTDALHSSVPTLIGARVDQSCRAEWFELMRG